MFLYYTPRLSIPSSKGFPPVLCSHRFLYLLQRGHRRPHRLGQNLHTSTWPLGCVAVQLENEGFKMVGFWLLLLLVVVLAVAAWCSLLLLVVGLLLLLLLFLLLLLLSDLKTALSFDLVFQKGLIQVVLHGRNKKGVIKRNTH